MYFYNDFSHQTQTDDLVLNIVFNVSSNQQNWKRKFLNTFVNETWIFIFEFQWNTTEDLIVTSMNDFFTNMEFISLDANVYVLARKESLLIFEIYKKALNSQLTISLLCNNDMTQQELKKKNQLQKWNRRNDLTGVHFLVGYIPCAFIFVNNEVKYNSFFACFK